MSRGPDARMGSDGGGAGEPTPDWTRETQGSNFVGQGLVELEFRDGVALGSTEGAFHLTRTHSEDALGAIQRLNLRLFVHRQHQRTIGRIQVQPDDVAHLLGEQQVLRHLEGVVRAALDGVRLARPSTKRSRHLPTVGLLKPSRSVISVLDPPRALASTMRARTARAFARRFSFLDLATGEPLQRHPLDRGLTPRSHRILPHEATCLSPGHQPGIR